VPGCEKLQMMA